MNYHDLPQISSTQLKCAMNSFRHFDGFYVSKTRSAPDLSRRTNVLLGECVHEAILMKREVDDFLTTYSPDCFKSNGTLHPQKRKEYEELMSQSGKRVMKDSDFARVVGCCNAVLRHDLGRLVSREDIRFEEPIFWEDSLTGLECRAKPDFFYEDDDYVLAFDLKVSESCSPSAWPRIAKKLGYWLQDAHYSSGLAHKFGKPVQFVFWVIESHWPYRIARYEYDPISRERASERYSILMREIAKRKKTGDWSEPWESQDNAMVLDPWDVDLNEEELEGFEDEQEVQG